MVGLLGLDQTLRVASVLAGTSRRIPTGTRAKRTSAVQKLIDDLGCQETAEALIKHYGGAVIYLPRCTTALRTLRDIRIHQLANEGLQAKRSMLSITSDLARQFQLSDRRIWEIFKEPMPFTAQLTPSSL